MAFQPAPAVQDIFNNEQSSTEEHMADITLSAELLGKYTSKIGLISAELAESVPEENQQETSVDIPAPETSKADNKTPSRSELYVIMADQPQDQYSSNIVPQKQAGDAEESLPAEPAAPYYGS